MIINCKKHGIIPVQYSIGADFIYGSDGDIEKEISKIDGVLNLIELRVYNIYSVSDANNGYSSTRTTQKIKNYMDCVTNEEGAVGGQEKGRDCIDLKASDKMLFTENDTLSRATTFVVPSSGNNSSATSSTPASLLGTLVVVPTM